MNSQHIAEITANSLPKKLITISIPVLNEADNIGPLLQRLRQVTDSQPKYDFEFLFTDNASNDATFERLAEAARSDTRIRVVRFTRNFGFQASILENYLRAKGDAAIQIDADLQDPPELIPEFIATWESGYKVVYGIRRTRDEGRLLRNLRRVFYRIINRISDQDIPVDAGDFRLIDRSIIEHLREVKDNSPYIRGIISEFGYRQIGVPYDRTARTSGKSKFRPMSLIRLASDGICSQSTKPLEFITVFGFVVSFLSLLAAGFYFVWFILVTRKPPTGFTTLVILVLLSIGTNAAFVGVLGEYIGRIFRNTRQIPRPIVSDIIDSDQAIDRRQK